MADTAELVLGSSLGAELSKDEAGALARLMTCRELEDGEFLISEGVVDDTLHVLLAGKLEVVKRTGADESASLAILRAGALAGELSFVDGAVHTVGLRALCDSRVLSLKRNDFEDIVDDNPQLVYKVMRAVSRSAHRIVHRMNYEFIELSNYVFKQHGRY
ncbi:MAG: cyclic nucleotide-binding domain-containing protein [Woeseiaceae bacterium]|nr:cyclic nucleotide-binding domain-containing protein [Woeseiaceae bacterium]